MEDKYVKLKIETVVNKILYEEGVINEKMYKHILKKLDKKLYEESKKNLTST